MNILLLAMMLATPAPPPAAELHNCPAPRTIILVRCPGHHEITTMTISCMVKRKIDECAQVAQGEGREQLQRAKRLEAGAG